MADLENGKVVDKEKQQPLLDSASKNEVSEKVESGAGEKKRTVVSSINKITRVTLILLLILNVVQWRNAIIAQDAASKEDQCLKQDSAVLKMETQIRGLCFDRVALLKSLESTNKLAKFPSNSGHEALQSLEDFLSTTAIESEAISNAFKLVEKTLAEQSELLHSVSHPYAQQDLDSLCDMLL